MHNSATEELFLDIGDGELRLPRRRLGLYYQLTRKADVRANSTSHTETLKVRGPVISTGTYTRDWNSVMPCAPKDLQNAKFTVQCGRVSGNHGCNL